MCSHGALELPVWYFPALFTLPEIPVSDFLISLARLRFPLDQRLPRVLATTAGLYIESLPFIYNGRLPICILSIPIIFSGSGHTSCQSSRFATQQDVLCRSDRFGSCCKSCMHNPVTRRHRRVPIACQKLYDLLLPLFSPVFRF
jgi:hypothetical protein